MIKYESYANEFMDFMESQLKVSRNLPKPDAEVEEFLKSTASSIKQAVKFKLPDNGNLFEDNEHDPTQTMKKFIAGRLNLPFPVITMEFTELKKEDSKFKVLVLAEEQGDEIHMRVAMGELGRMNWIMPETFLASINRDTFEVGVYRDAEIDDVTKPWMELSALLSTRVLTQILCALSCSNTVIADDSVKPSPVKQNIRRSKGKTPFFTFKILTINTSKPDTPIESSDPSKGAGKRSHLRRGHIRKYQNGMTTWVNSCFVGSKDKGRVEKEYRLI